MRMNEVVQGDALTILRTLPDASVDAIVTDPPYFRVKKEAWDRQWDTREGFLAWVASLCVEWRRVLKPNGSLYVFASPQMSAGVAELMRQYFHVLNRIRWVKAQGWHKKSRKEDLRAFLSPWEEIIFAEQYGADSVALGESGYAAQCERLHGFVFEPLRAYLDGERKRAGIRHREVIKHLGMTGHDSHFFSPVQWKLPLADQYEAMRALFNSKGGEYLRRDYEDLRRDYEDLRRDYEDLRQEYETLRRPFAVTEDVPYTDLWTFDAVPPRKGRHPCEKPLSLCRHIIRTSTRPGDLVLDCFAGSGAILEAAQLEGRDWLGIEISDQWVNEARRRLGQVVPVATPVPPTTTKRTGQYYTPSLWEAAS